jgi:hypothetical protein
MEQADTRASPRLRAAFIIADAILLAIWGATLPSAIAAIRNPRGDAFQLIPAFWATLTARPLGLFALIGEISSRGKRDANASLALKIAGGG